MANINNILANFSVNQNNFITTITQIQKHTQITNKTINVFNQSVGELNNKLKAADYNAFALSFQYADKALRSVGNSSVVFEENLKSLSISTGISGEALEALSANARKLGVSTGLGAGQALKAYQVLASQIDVSKVGLEGLNALQAETMTLAKASGLGVEGVAMALSATINQFGLEASEANRVINVLAAGAKYGAAGIPELSEALGAVGVAARNAGLNVESASGALEVLSRGNLKGAEAGRALEAVMQGMQSFLGIDFNSTTLASGLEALKPRLNDAAYLTGVFGANHVEVARYLIANAAAVQEMTAKVTDSNVAQEQAEMRSETIASKMAVMRERVDNLKYSIFELTGGVSGYIGVLGEAMGGVANFIPLIGLYNQIQMRMAATTKAATGAQRGLNLAFKACPLLWIVTGITALIGVVSLAVNLFGKFNAQQNLTEKITGKVAGQIAVEQRGMNQLFDALKKTNPESEERKRLLAEMQQKYPGYLDVQGLEKAGEEELEQARKKANDELARTILLQEQKKNKEEAARKITEAERKVFDRFRKKGVNEQDINKYLDEINQVTQTIVGEGKFKAGVFSGASGNQIQQIIYKVFNDRKSRGLSLEAYSELSDLVDTQLEMQNALKVMKDFGRMRYGVDVNANSGLAPAGIPGTGAASVIPALQTTLPAAAQQSSQAAVTGGTRSTNVTINLGKLMENVNIYAREFRDGLNDLDNKVLESLTRVLNVAQSSVI